MTVPAVPERTSEILIGRGFPDPFLPERGYRRTAAIFAQHGAAPVAMRVFEAVGTGPMMYLPDRDEAKTIAVVEKVYRWLAGVPLGRHDTIVGVGGGAATDLAGFVAATWLRGVESVMVPTTILGAVDASIGGKTGINLKGKNLVGAFHLPSRVIVDLDVMDTVPAPLRLEGLAEALKAGLVADPALVELFERHGPSAPMDEVVIRSIKVKAEVVGADFREDGRRAILNFGHTIGHGVEMAAGMPHGMAVAIGMVAAGAVSAARYGFPAQWLTDVIFSLGLPVSAFCVSRDSVLGFVGMDKKRTADGIRMVLLRSVGI
ncbi:MAG: 3-dehydroquinate synthase family protein, partial [Acidimicrobiia bacterium]